MQPLPVFPNYTQLPTRVPMRAWYVARVVTVTGVLGLTVLLIVRPEIGLPVFWGLIVPSLPLVWLTAPGLWRNICPLAAANQTPRLFGFSRAATPPAWLSRYAYIIGFVIFVLLVTGRKWLFNDSGMATAVLLLTVLVAAAFGGYLFKGKSGWCSSVCPLLPVQRLYGQTPFATVPNAHCRPCVGCTRNCYDFNPAVAQFADLADDDPDYVGYRRLFAGILPGLVVAFFTIPDVGPRTSVAEVYGLTAIYLLISLGAYYALDAFAPLTKARITALFGAVAISLFYWYGLVRVREALDALTGVLVPEVVAWLGRGGVIALAVVWLVRTGRREDVYDAQSSTLQPARVGGMEALKRHAASSSGKPEVTFDGPDVRRVVVDSPRPLLDIAEQIGLLLEAGCRMGVCGADPVAILAGADNLSEVGTDELGTLDRLGYATNTRMACMARVLGPVSVSLEPQEERPEDAGGLPDSFDESVRSVVVVGNGIAGVTAADHVRRRHPDCEIHVIGREVHHLYNRMAISRLIYGRSAMHGLYLQPEEWYDKKRITCWLNTRASRIDRERRVVVLATGEELRYDRLVLATGGYSWVPPIESFGTLGTFVLREAHDAASIRGFAQEHRTTRAVVAGGGLLGLEAAYALLKLGMHVTVLEVAARLLPRQLDERGSALLREYLEGLGLHVVTDATATRVSGSPRLQAVHLADGRELPTDLLLVAAGVRSNVELARDAGLEVDRGVVVDDEMCTSDPAIFAAGDVAQHNQQVYGLWPPAVDQARIAGVNAVSVDDRSRYQGSTPVTMLKVVGVDLLSLGRFDAADGETEVVLDDPETERYVKLVIDAHGRVVGGILLGHPELAPAVTAAVREARDVSGEVERLREGDWAFLNDVTATQSRDMETA